jgi:hypothetical protein
VQAIGQRILKASVALFLTVGASCVLDSALKLIVVIRIRRLAHGGIFINKPGVGNFARFVFFRAHAQTETHTVSVLNYLAGGIILEVCEALIGMARKVATNSILSVAIAIVSLVLLLNLTNDSLKRLTMILRWFKMSRSRNKAWIATNVTVFPYRTAFAKSRGLRDVRLLNRRQLRWKNTFSVGAVFYHPQIKQAQHNKSDKTNNTYVI